MKTTVTKTKSAKTLLKMWVTALVIGLFFSLNGNAGTMKKVKVTTPPFGDSVQGRKAAEQL